MSFFIRWLVPVIALSLGVLGFLHMLQGMQQATALPPHQTPPLAPSRSVIGVAGLVEASSENIAVGSALNGVVLEVHFPASSVGKRVTAGTPLFRIDDRHLRAELEVAQAQLFVAEKQHYKLKSQPRVEEIAPSLASVRAAEERLAKFRDKYERARKLSLDGTVSNEEFVEKDREYRAAAREHERLAAAHELLLRGAWEPDLQVALAAIAERRATIKRIETEIERAVVRAPLDAELLQVNVRVGEQVAVAPGQALVLLGDQSQRHVRVDIDEQDIPRYRPGAKAIASARGAGDKTTPLTFVRVEPYVVPKRSLTGGNTERIDTRVLQAIYRVDDPQSPWYVGQQLDVFIEAE